jgi:hypothetical protein
MASPPDQESIDRESESEQVSRLKRDDQRVEEWLSSLKDEAEQRSPEVLSALAGKAKDVSEYLDKMAEKARLRKEGPPGSRAVTIENDTAAVGDAHAEQGYRGPDPEEDLHGDGADEDQGT